jgi:hypothetical protein
LTRTPIDSDSQPRLEFAQGLDDARVLASLGSVGDAYDNALAESFVDTIKTELIADRVWRSRDQLELTIVEYLGWFNHARLHQLPGDLPRRSSRLSWRSSCAPYDEVNGGAQRPDARTPGLDQRRRRRHQRDPGGDRGPPLCARGAPRRA